MIGRSIRRDSWRLLRQAGGFALFVRGAHEFAVTGIDLAARVLYAAQPEEDNPRSRFAIPFKANDFDGPVERLAPQIFCDVRSAGKFFMSLEEDAVRFDLLLNPEGR